MNRTAKYCQTMVTKRLAVKYLAKIADEIMPYGTSSLESWDHTSWNRLDDMVMEIRHLRNCTEKYYILKNILREIVK